MRLPLIALLALLPVAAYAADPWGKVDLTTGKAVHEKSCTSCHVNKYGGDGSKIYTRDGRKISNKQELLQRVGSCNAMINAGLFPEEEGAVAAWLNQQYYHFKN
ncbi:MAG: cytochrome c [Azonexus sp.]|jgi:mono/diheme cytochrome c family protein